MNRRFLLFIVLLALTLEGCIIYHSDGKERHFGLAPFIVTTQIDDPPAPAPAEPAR